MSKGTALMAMLAAMQSGMTLDGDYSIPRKGFDSSRPSTLTEKERKKRKKKNKARKKARRKNRK